MSWFEFFWRMLPDKCQWAGCSRHGVRGNENIRFGFVTCDGCDAKLSRPSVFGYSLIDGKPHMEEHL